MDRFLIFAWGDRTYGEDGGWQDCIGSSSNYTDAVELLHNVIDDNKETSGELLYGQIVNLNTKKLIYKWSLVDGERLFT